MLHIRSKIWLLIVVFLMSFSSSIDVKEMTDGTFKKDIKDGVVVVDFWAIWCGPCRIQAPIFESVASELKKEARFGKVDVDKNQIVSSLYSINAIPTILIFKDGKVAWRLEGVTDKKTLTETVMKIKNTK